MKPLHNALLALGALALAVIPLATITKAQDGHELFAGADMRAEHAIGEIAPSYRPWFYPLWKPPSHEVETLLFGLQSAIGAGALFYCLGYYRGRKAAMNSGSGRLACMTSIPPQ